MYLDNAIKTAIQKLVLDCELPVEHLTHLSITYYDQLTGSIIPEKYRIRKLPQAFERFDVLLEDEQIKKDFVATRQITGKPELCATRESLLTGQTLDDALESIGDSQWIAVVFLRQGFDEEDRRRWRAVVIMNGDLANAQQGSAKPD